MTAAQILAGLKDARHAIQPSVSRKKQISHPFTVATPINKNHKSNSNRDYREQLDRHKMGLQLMWDDAKGNPTNKVGGFFAFVHNSQEVTFHIITDILPPSQRLSTWSSNVGQTDRNVLYISDPILTIPWDCWLSLGCPKKIQGTTRIVSAHNSLTKFLDNFEYIDETGEIVI